jgi:undecaprenyl-diphosphatase
LFITAFLVALSRPYCGVHYPSDVFFGGIIGGVIGYLLSIAAIKTDLFIQSKFGKKEL